jgi:hypothetical protein
MRAVVIDVFPPAAVPVIVGQPEDAEAFRGGAVVFTAEATGSPPFFQYQWFKGGEALHDGERVSGATTPELRLIALEDADAGVYSVEVTNSEGSVMSAGAQLTVLEPVAPTIIAATEGGRFATGATVVLAVEATGSDPLHFQWRRNGEDLSDDAVLSGTRGDMLLFEGIRLEDTGSYEVAVSNPGGTAVSALAFVEVFIPPPPDAVLAEWHFNQFGSSSTSSGFEELIDADVGEGLLFVRSATNTGTNFRRDTGGGTTLNASEGTPAGGRIELRRGQRWNNGTLEFRFDMTGYETALLSFAYETRDSAPSLATVEWSTDGGKTFTEYTVLDNSLFGTVTLMELDFAGIAAIANAPDVRVRLRYSADGGGVSAGMGAALDNVRIDVWAPPAAPPGTYAAWRVERFGSLDDPMGAPAFDPFQRGIANALEYAFGLDLLDDFRGGFPYLFGNFELAFTRRVNSAARLIVETSSTLSHNDWTAISTLEPGSSAWTGTASVGESGAGEVRDVLVTHPQGLPVPGEPRFLRVRVEITE